MMRPDAELGHAGHPHTVAELARISWCRARGFPSHLRTAAAHSTVDRRRTTPRWLIPLIWPAFAASAARDARWIRTLPGASATVEPSQLGLSAASAADSRARKAGVRFRMGILGAVLTAVLGFTVVADLLSPSLVLAAGYLLLVLLMAVWSAVLVQVLGEHRRNREEPEANVKDLKRRRDELAGNGPAYVLTSVMADRDGTGAATALLEALKTEWAAQGAVVVLYPASERLIGYYARRGAVIEQGAQRRMIFDYRVQR